MLIQKVKVFAQFNLLKVLQTFNSDELNNTRKADREVLFFNRVPKVGSQSMMALIDALSNRNNFTVYADFPRIYETILLNPLMQVIWLLY